MCTSSISPSALLFFMGFIAACCHFYPYAVCEMPGAFFIRNQLKQTNISRFFHWEHMMLLSPIYWTSLQESSPRTEKVIFRWIQCFPTCHTSKHHTAVAWKCSWSQLHYQYIYQNNNIWIHVQLILCTVKSWFLLFSVVYFNEFAHYIHDACPLPGFI